jgi:hypothetical protein
MLPAKATARNTLHHSGGNEGELGAMVAGGYLPEEARGDPMAIKTAVEVVLSDLAFELEQKTKGSGSRL